jgi:hypothetical protein
MRRRDAAILLMSIAATAVSCRGLPLPNSTQLPTEHQVPVQQLVFHSDFDLPEDHRLVRELTAERDDVSTVLGLPPSDEEIHVYLFRDAQTYGQYLNRHFPLVPSRRAFFVETDTRLEVYAHWSDRVAEDLRHEVAHGYLHAAVPAIPLWLDEGLAEYFEVPRGHSGLNRPHLMLLADMTEHNGWKPKLANLEALESAGDMQQIHYAEAWAWVHFLLNSTPERRELLTSYLALLRENGSADPLSARLAAQHIQPQRTLAEYLLALKAEHASH